MIFRIDIQRRDGALERVVAAMYRKRVSFDALTAVVVGDVWTVEVSAHVPAERLSYVVAAIAREPVVIDVLVVRP